STLLAAASRLGADRAASGPHLAHFRGEFAFSADYFLHDVWLERPALEPLERILVLRFISAWVRRRRRTSWKTVSLGPHFAGAGSCCVFFFGRGEVGGVCDLACGIRAGYPLR